MSIIILVVCLALVLTQLGLVNCEQGIESSNGDY